MLNSLLYNCVCVCVCVRVHACVRVVKLVFRNLDCDNGNCKFRFHSSILSILLKCTVSVKSNN